jgi:Fe-S-cluster containining protein
VADLPEREDELRMEFNTVKREIQTHGPRVALDNSRRRHSTLGEAILSGDPQTLACREGCSFCCYFRIVVNAHEVIRIIEHCNNNFSKTRIEEILFQAKVNADKLSGIPKSKQLAVNLKCPFLLNDSCQIYSVRPAACRDFHSVEVEGCQYSFNNPEDITSPNGYIPHLRVAETDHSQACNFAFFELGYDPNTYEFNTALIEAIENSSSMKRFKNKKKAFLNAIQD